eukprot:766914-Hanusia_phi.AAC.7
MSCVSCFASARSFQVSFLAVSVTCAVSRAKLTLARACHREASATLPEECGYARLGGSGLEERGTRGSWRKLHERRRGRRRQQCGESFVVSARFMKGLSRRCWRSREEGAMDEEECLASKRFTESLLCSSAPQHARRIDKSRRNSQVQERWRKSFISCRLFPSDDPCSCCPPSNLLLPIWSIWLWQRTVPSKKSASVRSFRLIDYRSKLAVFNDYSQPKMAPSQAPDLKRSIVHG